MSGSGVSEVTLPNPTLSSVLDTRFGSIRCKMLQCSATSRIDPNFNGKKIYCLNLHWYLSVCWHVPLYETLPTDPTFVSTWKRAPHAINQGTQSQPQKDQENSIKIYPDQRSGTRP